MNAHEIANRPMEEPLAELERELISAFIAGAGQES